MKVSELRELLKERRLPISGIKATLIDRLAKASAHKQSKNGAPIVASNVSNLQQIDEVTKGTKESKLPANLERSSKDEKKDESDWYSEMNDDDKIVDPNQTVSGPSSEEPKRNTFREDFQGTRVFVQGLSEDTTWQELKDHFQIAGSVVYATISIDRQTGRSKQHGLVQFETVAEAKKAVKEMRNHPLNGDQLYVREDVQESRKGPRQIIQNRYDDEVPNDWKRANDEDLDGGGEAWYNLRDNELKEIESLVEKRDKHRRQRNYKMSDKLRDQLKLEFGVHLDDRLKKWWTETKHGGIPAEISEIKGEGRWGKQKPWHQIPTPSDDMVDTENVMRLLQKRDRARRMKNFDAADELLRQAHACGKGGLGLRIHDESRTWRTWTEKPPPRQSEEGLSPEEACLEIVNENEPEKVDEIKSLLTKFPGREWNIYKRLKDRYSS